MRTLRRTVHVKVPAKLDPSMAIGGAISAAIAKATGRGSLSTRRHTLPNWWSRNPSVLCFSACNSERIVIATARVARFRLPKSRWLDMGSPVPYNTDHVTYKVVIMIDEFAAKARDAATVEHSSVSKTEPNMPSWLEEAEKSHLDPCSSKSRYDLGAILVPRVELVFAAIREHLLLHPDRLEDVPAPN